MFLFHVLVFLLQGMWDLSSPTRNWTCTPLHWKVKSQPLACQGSTKMHLFLTWGLFSFGWLTKSLPTYPGTNDFFAHNWRTSHFTSVKIWHTSFILIFCSLHHFGILLKYYKATFLYHLWIPFTIYKSSSLHTEHDGKQSWRNQNAQMCLQNMIHCQD